MKITNKNRFFRKNQKNHPQLNSKTGEKIKNNAGKNASKLVINNNCNFIKNFKVNLDQGFLTLEQSLYLFHQQKIFISYFSTKFLKLDPDPHLKSSWIRIRIEKSSWIHFCRMQIHSP